MKIYCIDIGNTRTHCALVEVSEVSDCTRLHRSDFLVSDSADYPSITFADIFKKFSPAEKLGAQAIAWCSVVPSYSSSVEKVVEASGLDSLQLTYGNSPVKLDVKEPSQVGQDRIAAAAGAAVFFNPPYIVVDMGTAVTIDLVDASGAYAGGAIAPGMHAFAEYLNERAAQLPKINPAEADYSLNVGKNTVEAMYVGCAKGFCRLADGIIKDIEGEFFGGKSARDKTVFTGGSVSLLPKNWLAERRIEDNLTHLGLAKSYFLKRKNIKETK